MELSFKQTKISIICGRGGKTNLVLDVEYVVVLVAERTLGIRDWCSL